MEPTIPQGSLVDIVLDSSYGKKLKRFDIVAYKFDSGTFEGETHIKRIIGLPGEEIEIKKREVTINGKPLDLPVAVDLDDLARKPVRLVIPEDSVFVIGDNTKNSADSRYVGPILISQILGYFTGLSKK